MNTLYNVQLAVKTKLICCTICTMYTQLHVSAYLGHLKVVSHSLENELSYWCPLGYTKQPEDGLN